MKRKDKIINFINEIDKRDNELFSKIHNRHIKEIELKPLHKDEGERYDDFRREIKYIQDNNITKYEKRIYPSFSNEEINDFNEYCKIEKIKIELNKIASEIEIKIIRKEFEIIKEENDIKKLEEDLINNKDNNKYYKNKYFEFYKNEIETRIFFLEMNKEKLKVLKDSKN